MSNAPYTTEEAAELVGIPPDSLRDWLRRGKIPAGPKSNGALGRYNRLYWSQVAIDQAKEFKISLERRRNASTPDSPETQIFFAMRARCCIKTNKSYPEYGGRGITVCERWLAPLDGFANFLEDMGRRPSPKHSLDRINNDLGYSKENCQWATGTEQTRNRRKTLKDESGTPLAELADKIGIKYSVLYGLYRRGKRGQELISAARSKGAGK